MKIGLVFDGDGSIEEAVASLKLVDEVSAYNANVLSQINDKAILREHGRETPVEPVTLDDLKTIAIDLLS